LRIKFPPPPLDELQVLRPELVRRMVHDNRVTKSMVERALRTADRNVSLVAAHWPTEVEREIERVRLDAARLNLPLDARVTRKITGTKLVIAWGRRGGRPSDGVEHTLVEDLVTAGVKRALARQVAQTWLKRRERQKP